MFARSLQNTAKKQIQKKKRKTGRNRTTFSENYEGPRTNRSTYLYQRLHVWTRKFSPLTREIRHGPSRPDPHETRVSGVNRSVAGRVGSFRNIAVQVGSGQQVCKSGGSGRVGSTVFFQISRVGSGRVRRCSKSHGSGRVKFTSPHFTLLHINPLHFTPLQLTSLQIMAVRAAVGMDSNHCTSRERATHPSQPVQQRSYPVSQCNSLWVSWNSMHAVHTVVTPSPSSSSDWVSG